MSTRRDFIKTASLTGVGMFFSPFLLRSAATPNSPAGPLRYRQVHLDFHTSGLIQDVAKRFDAEKFAATLKKASVNSVTSFARCHHGYLYYDSKVNPERIHPHLTNKNLLKEQIEACHKQNIRVPIYTTVQWDHYTALQHPEWLVRDEKGAPIGMGDTQVFQPGFYNHLDVSTPYLDFLKKHLADLFESVPVDGLFLDIHHALPNANPWAIDGMLKKGIDPTKEENRLRYDAEVLRAYKEEVTAFIRKLDKHCTIFYNGGHISPHVRNSVAYNSHLELESLPSGGWGYLHFPLTSRYARNLDKDIMGMTGKFHTSWGDFHSLKNPAALEFETSLMLALNARCSIGDQLHPSGVLDAATYDLIGDAFGKVAQKEPWCEGATAMTDIAVISAEEFGTPGMAGRSPESMMGAVRLLQEGGHQFDVVDSESDFTRYKLLILPDIIPVDSRLKDKIQTYTKRGGALLCSYQSGLATDKQSFALDMGVTLVGDAPYSPDFWVAEGPLAKGLPQTELVMYKKGLEVKAAQGAEVLMKVDVPYFNREWNHFSSHKHTPSAGKVGYPGVVRKENRIYFMHPIFSQYNKNAPRWVKTVFLNAVEMLLPAPMVKHNGPSSLVVTLNEQKPKGRMVLHLLHYVPERRGTDFDVVEDVLPVYNIAVSVKANRKVQSVQLVPQMKNVPFRIGGDRLEITVPEIKGHQMIVIS